jgi:hypothetical protein
MQRHLWRSNCRLFRYSDLITGWITEESGFGFRQGKIFLSSPQLLADCRTPLQWLPGSNPPVINRLCQHFYLVIKENKSLNCTFTPFFLIALCLIKLRYNVAFTFAQTFQKSTNLNLGFSKKFSRAYTIGQILRSTRIVICSFLLSDNCF